MQDTPTFTKHPVKPPNDPTTASRTWAIALIASAGLLLAAIGIIVWLILVRNAGVATIPAAPVDPSVNVKSVSFVLPADMPATYVKNDQSKVGESVVFYDDETTMCSIMLATLPVDGNKVPQEVAIERLGTAYAQGASTKLITGGERFVVAETDGAHQYSFDSVLTEQSVDVPAVGFASRKQVTLFKQMGNNVASLGYGCKTEAWAAKQEELAKLVTSITLRTER